MRVRLSRLVAAVTFWAVSVPVAHASLVGSTYDYTISQTGSTQLLAGTSPDGIYTDPANPFVCIGPAGGCGIGSGVSGSFAFADVTPTTATITFNFFGSTDPATGSFAVDLSNIAAPGGATITAVSRASGNLTGGSNFNVTSFGATDIDFTGTPSGSYDAIGGGPIVFQVTEAVPEPASVALVGAAMIALAAIRRRGRGAEERGPGPAA